MYHSVVGSLIQHIFEEKCGRNQGHKPVNEREGLALTLNLHTRWDEEKDVPLEEGYRYADMVIYASTNYVNVWVRERSNLAPVDDEGYVCGDYVESSTEWKQVASHDSCWRAAVDDFFYEYNDSHSTLRGGGGIQGGHCLPYIVLHRDELRKDGIKTPMELDDFDRKREKR